MVQVGWGPHAWETRFRGAVVPRVRLTPGLTKESAVVRKERRRWEAGPPPQYLFSQLTKRLDPAEAVAPSNLVPIAVDSYV